MRSPAGARPDRRTCLIRTGDRESRAADDEAALTFETPEARPLAELGLQLFERTSRHATITDAGLAFLARARTILGDIEGLAYEMAECAGAVRGRVRLGFWYHLDPRLPELLRMFVRETRSWTSRSWRRQDPRWPTTSDTANSISPSH